ncbi:MAG: hypothetical protein CL933_08250 [Deltaproteobacteria bacterium]|nr:hypothetical protein [Deltaproteobacteria bacterium]
MRLPSHLLDLVVSWISSAPPNPMSIGRGDRALEWQDVLALSTASHGAVMRRRVFDNQAQSRRPITANALFTERLARPIRISGSSPVRA